MNELDLQFKIFTLESYVILNESMNKLLSVSESIVLMGYAFYETSFNDPTVKHVCIYFEITYTKNCKKQTFKDHVTRQKISTVRYSQVSFRVRHSED